MLRRVNMMVARVVEFGLWLGFVGLLATVGLQVLSRTVFKIPLIWTPDLAQLLFSWLIFVGAAIALRRKAHYSVDMLPANWVKIDIPLTLLGFLVSAAVIYLLVVNGTFLTQLRMSGTIQSLGISRGWIFASIPVAGLLMGLFSLEALLDIITGKTDR